MPKEKKAKGQKKLNRSKEETVLTTEKVISALKKVKDPELGIDVYTLGLIYDITIGGRTVKIRMTMTTPMCPYGPMLMDQVAKEVEQLKVKVALELTFDPPWQPSAELKEMLGLPP